MRKSKAWLAVVFCLMTLGAAISWGEKECGEARIISGGSCPTLRVVFQLRECGNYSTQQAEINCQSDPPVATSSKGDSLFYVPLRELAPGVWTVVGTVRSYPVKSPPKNPSAYSFVVRGAPVSTSASESVTSLFELGGDFRFRIEQNAKRDFNADQGFSSIRLRVPMLFRPNQRMFFLLEPQANSVLGEPQWAPATQNVNVPVGMSGSNRDPLLSFHQAFGEFRIGSFWRWVIGRQVFSYGDEVLVGASDWENPGRSFDGVRSRVEWGKSWWDLFSTKLWDSNSKGQNGHDKDFHGTYLHWSHPNQSVSMEPYFLWLRDHRARLTQLYSAGLRTQFSLSELEFRGEVTGQWGESTGQQAWLELSSKTFSNLQMRLSADGFWSNSEFNPLFPTTHKWLGWADVLARKNISGLGVKLEWVPAELWEVTMRGIHFLRTRTDAEVYQVDGISVFGASAWQGQAIGSEVDLCLRTKLASSIEVVSGASVFFPSEPFRGTLSDSWIGRFELSLAAAF